MEENNYRRETNKWLKAMHIKGSVIDIGGGKRTAKERLGSHEGTYDILDRAEYKGLKFEPDIEHDMNYCLGQSHDYDYAFMLFMFEFLWNPVVAFENVNRLLKKGGKFYFNAPYKMPTEGYVYEDFYRLTANGADKLLKETGFRMDKITKHTGEYDFYLVEATKI